MQGKETERDVSNCNIAENKLDDVLALAYNNCSANIKSHVEVTNNISTVKNVRVAYHSDILFPQLMRISKSEQHAKNPSNY